MPAKGLYVHDFRGTHTILESTHQLFYSVLRVQVLGHYYLRAVSSSVVRKPIGTNQC